MFNDQYPINNVHNQYLIKFIILNILLNLILATTDSMIDI